MVSHLTVKRKNSRLQVRYIKFSTIGIYGIITLRKGLRFMSYPQNYARANCMCSEYAEIAFRNYFDVKQKCLTYKITEFDFDIFHEAHLLNQKAIVTVVFAQMSIESFLNDYAAACLGDDECYDNFDKLDFISKFQLIFKFILQDTLDKSREPYTSLKVLSKWRNSYIHNKSYSLDGSITKFESIEDADYLDAACKMETKYIKDILHEAESAIKAIIEIVNFFEERDNNTHATFKFFSFSTNPYDLEEAVIKRELSTLGLKHEIQI